MGWKLRYLEALGETSRGRANFCLKRSVHNVGLFAERFETRCECELDLSDGGDGCRSCTWSCRGYRRKHGRRQAPRMSPTFRCRRIVSAPSNASVATGDRHGNERELVRAGDDIILMGLKKKKKSLRKGRKTFFTFSTLVYYQ